MEYLNQDGLNEVGYAKNRVLNSEKQNQNI